MARSGIPVFVWHPPSVKSRAKPLMHHKFCLFGKKSVWTGSYNFSYQAVRAQRENAVILHDEEISQQFAQEFENMRKDHVVTYEKYLEQVPFKWASKTR
jgi:phosphatidylserine/phosphatidylglycerophosphate/cardiolipin synthase-like enzyme